MVQKEIKRDQLLKKIRKRYGALELRRYSSLVSSKICRVSGYVAALRAVPGTSCKWGASRAARDHRESSSQRRPGQIPASTPQGT